MATTEAIPAKVKRTLYRGDRRTWTHVFTDTTTGDPIDITDWTFVSQFRADLNRGDLVCESTTTVYDGPNGIAVEVLTSDEADGLPGQTSPATYPVVYWDLQSTDGDGHKQTWKYAFCKVEGDASNG